MTTTLRERLFQALVNKRQKLMKEKEQLDIADTNALLLHPSQFSITNPASPGSQPTSRKTRFTRNREHEELNGVSDVSHRRKRKLVEDDVGSPSRNGISTPAERARATLAPKPHPSIPSIPSSPKKNSIFNLTKRRSQLGIILQHHGRRANQAILEGADEMMQTSLQARMTSRRQKEMNSSRRLRWIDRLAKMSTLPDQPGPQVAWVVSTRLMTWQRKRLPVQHYRTRHFTHTKAELEPSFLSRAD